MNMFHHYSGIKQKLMEIHEVIKDFNPTYILSGPEELIKPSFERIDRLVQEKVSTEIVDRLLTDPELKRPIADIVELRGHYNVRIELEYATQILNSADPWSVIKKFYFYPNYEWLSVQEGKNASLQPGDRVIFLGCGPFPLSLVMLNKLFSIRGVGIEKDHGRAALAQNVVRNLELTGVIDIRSGDELLLEGLNNYKLLMVAAVAEPKNHIFNTIYKYLPPNALVAYRTYERGLRRLLYPPLNKTIINGFEEVKRISPEPPVNNTIVFLKKRG